MPRKLLRLGWWRGIQKVARQWRATLAKVARIWRATFSDLTHFLRASHIQYIANNMQKSCRRVTHSTFTEILVCSYQTEEQPKEAFTMAVVCNGLKPFICIFMDLPTKIATRGIRQRKNGVWRAVGGSVLFTKSWGYKNPCAWHFQWQSTTEPSNF